MYTVVRCKKKKWSSCNLLVGLETLSIGRKRKVSLRKDWIVDDITDPNVPDREFSFMLTDSEKTFYFAANSKKEGDEIRAKIVVCEIIPSNHKTRRASFGFLLTTKDNKRVASASRAQLLFSFFAKRTPRVFFP